MCLLMFSRHQFLRIFSVREPKTPHVLDPVVRVNEEILHFTNEVFFSCLSDLSEPHRYRWNGTTAHDRCLPGCVD